MLVAALGLEGDSGWHVEVTAESMTPDPGEPADGQARQLLRQAFNVPEGRDFLVVARPATSTLMHVDVGPGTSPRP